MQNFIPENPKKQTGAALIVALILLLVITMLGVSAVSTSSLEILMAGNSQYSQQAFQAAESAIESEIALGNLSTSLNRVGAYSYPNNASASTQTGYVIAGEVPAGGYSLGAGFQAYHFETAVTAAAPRSATSRHRQGFYIVGPGS